jgi:hypothetical protein
MKTIRAHYKDGVIHPLEPLQLPEDSELILIIVEATGLPPEETEPGPFSDLVGAWDGQVDCDRFLRDVYRSRAFEVGD